MELGGRRQLHSGDAAWPVVKLRPSPSRLSTARNRIPFSAVEAPHALRVSGQNGSSIDRCNVAAWPARTRCQPRPSACCDGGRAGAGDAVPRCHRHSLPRWQSPRWSEAVYCAVQRTAVHTGTLCGCRTSVAQLQPRSLCLPAPQRRAGESQVEPAVKPPGCRPGRPARFSCQSSSTTAAIVPSTPQPRHPTSPASASMPPSPDRRCRYGS
jgi:hypothetical protein